jgi:Fe-S-cluster-containing hydrogenase component 2
VKCDSEMSHVVAEFSNSHTSPIPSASGLAKSIIPLSNAPCESHCPHGAIATKDKRTKHHKHY